MPASATRGPWSRPAAVGRPDKSSPRAIPAGRGRRTRSAQSRCGRTRPQRRSRQVLAQGRRLPQGDAETKRHTLSPLGRLALLGAYRIEILPLWAPWAPAVSRFGGGVPGMNGAFAAYAGGRAMSRVTPCPTPPSAGIAASGAAAGAAWDLGPTAEEGPKAVTGMAAPWRRRLRIVDVRGARIRSDVRHAIPPASSEPLTLPA